MEHFYIGDCDESATKTVGERKKIKKVKRRAADNPDAEIETSKEVNEKAKENDAKIDKKAKKVRKVKRRKRKKEDPGDELEKYVLKQFEKEDLD